MKATGTFTPEDFTPTDVVLTPLIETALLSRIYTMQKTYAGEVAGRSATLFTAANDQASGIGTYVALEAFEGSLLNHQGSFNFVHAASTSGQDRTNEYFCIVPGSGTNQLQSIHGTGGMAVEPDGTHRIWFDFDI